MATAEALIVYKVCKFEGKLEDLVVTVKDNFVTMNSPSIGEYPFIVFSYADWKEVEKLINNHYSKKEKISPSIHTYSPYPVENKINSRD